MLDLTYLSTRTLQQEYTASLAALQQNFPGITALLTEHTRRLRERATAWQTFAEHRETCAECAASVTSCRTGQSLRIIAMGLTPVEA